MLQEREALLAQAGLLSQEKARITDKLRDIARELKSEPVIVASRRGGRR